MVEEIREILPCSLLSITIKELLAEVQQIQLLNLIR
jgi:hypothetical protein